MPAGVYPGRAHKSIWLTVRKKRSILPRPRGMPGSENTSDIFEVRTDLLQMRRGKIAPVIAVESRRNTDDLPMGYGLTPNGLAQGQSRLDGRRRLQGDSEPSNGPAVIIHDDGEPRAHGRSIAVAYPDIQ